MIIKLDQTSIPTLCSGVIKMAHTLVGKAVCLVCLQPKSYRINPLWGQSADHKQD